MSRITNLQLHPYLCVLDPLVTSSNWVTFSIVAYLPQELTSSCPNTLLCLQTCHIYRYTSRSICQVTQHMFPTNFTKAPPQGALKASSPPTKIVSQCTIVYCEGEGGWLVGLSPTSPICLDEMSGESPYLCIIYISSDTLEQILPSYS